ncbi:hypothetical protein Tco_1448381 [Tanacetum coccineum]
MSWVEQNHHSRASVGLLGNLAVTGLLEGPPGVTLRINSTAQLFANAIEHRNLRLALRLPSWSESLTTTSFS